MGRAELRSQPSAKQHLVAFSHLCSKSSPFLRHGCGLYERIFYFFGVHASAALKSTYLMKGEEPIAVTAVTKQFKPAIYPRVDDDATIIITYPTAECIIQASWNWPFSRKDMEVYGETGYVFADNNTSMRLRNQQEKTERSIKVNARELDVYEDPFSYFADVVKGRIKVPTNGLYSLENNMMVVKILDAARKSAKTGKTVMLKEYK